MTSQPWQFQPETYGAKGDGKVIGDAVLASNTTLTSATAAFTSADTGKHIMVHGALGTTSGPLLTTITFVNSTTVTLGSAASVTGTGYPAVYGTDDTAAINSAVAAAGSYATTNSYFAEVVFAAKIYVLASGPTQTGNGITTPTFNAQIPLPYPNVNGTGQKMIIALTGAGDNGYCQYWESTTPNVAGTALVSMITAPSSPSGTFGNQSVIGGPAKGGAGFTGTFANVKVIVTGIGVWCPIYTNIWAYDFSAVSAMRAEQSAAQIFAPTGVNGGALPHLQDISAPAFTGSIGTGWRAPANGNNADVTMDDVNAEGYECAYRLADHFNGARLAAIYSDVAVLYDGSGDTGTSHGIYIQSIAAEVYNVGLDATGGTAQVDITWDAECSGVTADVSDGGNRLFGLFRFRDPANARFPVVSGAGNLAIVCDQLGPGHWSGAPGVPASTVAQQNTAWRNAWIVIHAGVGVTVSAVTIDGTATGLTMAASSSLAVRVPSGKSITLTYAGGAPTWDWWLD